MIIESAVIYSKDLELMIEAIQRNITDAWFNNMSSLQICADNRTTVCPNDYATPGSTLNDGYFLSRLPVVEKRLAQVGSAWLLPSTVSSLVNQKLLKHEDKERIGMVIHL